MTSNLAIFDEMVGRLRPVVWAIAAVSFFINLMILPMSLYALQVMDRVISTGSIATLVWLTLIMMVMFAFAGLMHALRSVTLARAADWLHSSITDLALPITLTQAAAGNRGAQYLRDATSLRHFLSGPGVTTLLDAPWSVLYMIGLFIMHAALGVLVSVGALILLLLAWLNEIATRNVLKESGNYQARSMHELELATRNAEVTEAMGMSSSLTSRWKQMQGHTSKLQLLASGRASLIQGITKFVRLTLQILITGISAWLAIHGEVTIGAIIASAILASRALAPFEAAISSWKSFSDARNAYCRLREAFADAPQREEGMQLPAPSGIVSAEELEYAHVAHERPVLRQIQFRLEAGESLGVIGASGSGKSTLARLVTGVYAPTAGAIRLDGADIYRWSREDFGKYVGYLPQDVELFSGSICDNIARFNKDAKSEDIVKASQIANAHDLILRLPQGYDTHVGPAGAFLSAGQRQRIGLARAFFGGPKVLVLDEPDASLDDTGQQALIMALRRARQQGVTVFMITHRRPLLAHVDKLLFLHEGTVAAYGPVAAVMESLAALKNKRIAEGAKP